jgi:phosphonopyruvate decarboxylase
MISSNRLLDELVRRGVGFFTGVPCSYLTPLINSILMRSDIRHVLASSEGEALATSAGVWLAGSLGVVMCQNSGLGNMVNPLTSLSATFRIPSLLLITWRGRPGERDEPQHNLMGQITPKLLDLMNVPWAYLPENEIDLSSALDKAFRYMAYERYPYAFIIKKGDISLHTNSTDYSLQTAEVQSTVPQYLYGTTRSSRIEALTAFLKVVPYNSPVIATTGKCGRELFTLNDRKQHFYCVGSMGYASALAHGVALMNSHTVYILDGDGSLIMHMGNLTSIGAARTKNLVHVVLDNGTHDSTGGQPTVSSSIDFVRIAAACGYHESTSCIDLNDFKNLVSQTSRLGPRFIHLRIKPGSLSKLGRPTLMPSEVAQRLRQFICITSRTCPIMDYC